MNNTATDEPLDHKELDHTSPRHSAPLAGTAGHATAVPNTQPEREHNIEALVAYFKSGIKTTPGNIGIELEHTLVHSADRSPVSYNEERGAQWILRQLQSDYPTTICDAVGDLIGVFRPNESVTLEPASQLELSAGPFGRLADAEATFEAFEEKLA
ncbi:MAG: hypothetical protein RSD80_05220, partial [Raoultibacter sp.]